MTKFFPKVFITGIVLFLLLGAGYGITQAARAIPWDCADWQAFAHEDRTTVILESLAENRGKTLYCGVDQSDTFTKAETWEAGKDRNERDDTIYSGERGIFRGFIAAQEGWLTDGESGVTGVSIDRIFEFPREERRRTKRVKRFAVGSGPVTSKTDNTCPTNLRGGRQPGTLLCTGWSTLDNFWGSDAVEQREARNRAVGHNPASTWVTVDWEANIRYPRLTTGLINTAVDPYGPANPNTAWWQAQAEAAADPACRARGARYVAGSAAFGPGHSDDNGGGVRDPNHTGWGLGFFLDKTDGPGSNVKYQARQSRTWSATCKKVIRRTRK